MEKQEQRKFRVKIRATERVVYEQYVTVEERDLKEYREALRNPRYRGHADEILADWINRRDICDADDFDLDDLDLCDDEGNVVRGLYDADDIDAALATAGGAA